MPHPDDEVLGAGGILAKSKLLGYKTKVLTIGTNFVSPIIKKKLNDNLNAKILGPVIAPIFKINKNFRYRMLIRSTKTQKMQKSLSNVLNNFKNQKEIKLAVDVDPISFN